MASFGGHVNRSTIDYDHSQIPGSFNPVPALPTPVTDSGQTSLFNDFPAPESAFYGTGRHESHDSGGEVTLEYADHPQRLSMWPITSVALRDSESVSLHKPNGGDALNSLFPDEILWAESCLYDSESYLHPSPGGFSFDSQIQVSNSTFSSCPTTISSPDYRLERSSCTSDVASDQIDMLIGVAKRKKNKKRKRPSDAESTGKHPAEIRISKKLRLDDKCQKDKAWLGTYATPAQQGRALDVGKYFLCTKKKKAFYDSNSEALLSAFQDRLRSLPLLEFVEIVKKMAKHYGEHGWLPESLHDL